MSHTPDPKTMKHTEEPWQISPYKQGLIGVDFDNPIRTEFVAQCHGKNEHNAQRIVDCVNALAGIEKPKEFIGQVSNMVKAFKMIAECLNDGIPIEKNDPIHQQIKRLLTT